MSAPPDVPASGPRLHALAEGSFDSQETLRSLLDSTLCSVVVVGRDHRIRSTNARFDDALGIPAGKSTGTLGVDVLHCAVLATTGRRCAAGDSCIACRASQIARLALSTKREQRSSIHVEVEARGSLHAVNVGLRAAALRIGGESFAILMFEGLDRLCDFRRWADEGGMQGIVGSDPKMFDLFETIRRVARTEVPVLIQGESGSGKELVATALHKESLRRDRRLVAVNCGALSAELLESELFGHVKGAFTGAMRRKKGRFELAQGGTIFLDEIGELSHRMQVKLLRVLQDGTFEPVGGEETVRPDARVIAATNQDLELAAATGRFRADLFYRICVVDVTVPPLRERVADISQLAEHLLGKAAREYSRDRPELSPAVHDVLSSYPWPGNVRELENAMRYALIRSRGSKLDLEHLPAAIVTHARVRSVQHATKLNLSDAKVAQALSEAKGSKSRAAHRLGISRATLYRYLAQRRKNGLRLE